MREITFSITEDLAKQLGITATATKDVIGAAIATTAKKAATADELQLKLTAETTAKQAAQKDLADLKGTSVKAMLETAVEDKKITVEVSARLEKDYVNNPDGLKELLTGMNVYTSVSQQIDKAKQLDIKQYEGKKWDELFKAGKTEELKANHRDLFNKLWKEEYGADYVD